MVRTVLETVPNPTLQQVAEASGCYTASGIKYRMIRLGIERKGGYTGLGRR